MIKTALKITGKEDIFYVNQKSDEKSLFSVQMCGITYPYKNYEIARANSRIVCIEYIEKGCGTVHISKETFHPCEGDVYILPPGSDHHYYSDANTPWKKVFVNLSGSLAESLIDGYQLKNHHHFKSLDIRNELYSIIDIARKGSDNSTEEIICIINRVFMKMRSSLQKKEKVPAIAEIMRDYLNAHATEKFQIESLCRHVSRSESRTIRIFKDAYGITPYAYVLGQKIRLAKDMLVNTGLSVKQIAYNLSFTDEYYFSNIFKSKTGHSPSGYRKIKS